MAGSKPSDGAKIVGKNVKAIRVYLDLTVQGFAAGTGISVNHIRLIEAGKSNITRKTAEKIAGFCDIDAGRLFSSRLLKIKRIENIPAVKKFYRDNKNNAQFFLSRRGENSVAHFLKTVLVPGKYFMVRKRGVSDVVTDCLEEYHMRFTSKEVSRELNRLVDRGVLAKEDKTGTGKRFLYYKPGS